LQENATDEQMPDHDDEAPATDEQAPDTLMNDLAGDKPFIESARKNAASSAPIPQLYREAIASERAAAGVSIAGEPQRDKEPHALEVKTMQIAFDRQEYAFEQDKLNAEEDKLDRKTARKNVQRKTTAYETWMKSKKVAENKVAAANEEKLHEEARLAKEQANMIVFDLEQKKAEAAAKQPPPGTASNEQPPPATAADEQPQPPSPEEATAASAAPTPAKMQSPAPAATATQAAPRSPRPSTSSRHAGIRQQAPFVTRKRARGKNLVLTKRTTERITSYFTSK